MKHFYFAFCLLSLSSFCQLSSDTLYTIVNGSRVEIRIDSTWRNCGAEYEEQIFFNVDTITWLQVDWGWCYGCTCPFNYSVTLDSLEIGSYVVNVYYTHVLNEIVFDSTTGTWIYTHTPCDTTYFGTTMFTITSSTYNNPVKVDSSATPCLITRINEISNSIIFPYNVPLF